MDAIPLRATRRGAWSLGGIAILGALLLLWPRAGRAQADGQDHAKHAAAAKPAGGDEALASEIRQLREKVQRLEAALSQGQGPGPSGPMGRGRGMDAGGMAGNAPGGNAPRVAAAYQDCTRCHQTRPSGPLPQSHLESQAGMRAGAASQGGGMSMMGGRRMGMGMMARDGMGMMDEMGMEMPAQGGMKPSGDQGMMDGDEMMGMGAMGKAKGMGMGHMKMKSTLPGFPGASHLYHVGADGFFLNHDAHITLTADQRERLSRIKEKALLGGSSCERKVAEAEQELWELTASDTPDAEEIEKKVREIEKLRGNQRLSFIRAVGEAANQLTDQQRRVLVGAASAAADTKH